MVIIHGLAMAIIAVRSIALVVCDSSSPLQAKALMRLVLSYPTFKIHFKNGDSYQVITQAIGQELLLTTLHPLPTGSRIMGGQGKSQRHLGWGNPGQPLRLDCF
jgi:hypothetical protein